MTDHRCLTLRLPADLADRLHRAALQQNCPADVLVQQVLLGALKDQRNAVPRPDETDERLLAPIRALLAPEFGEARGWDDLQARLANKGYTLRERGGALALYVLQTATRVCNASEIGQTYGDLMIRFGRPFPGHAHAWIADRLCGHAAAEAPSHQRPRPTGEDEDVLIEPW